MTKRTIIVGGSLEEAAKRVAETWHRAERGEPVEAEDNVTFTSWSVLVASVMSDKQHELLKHLHRHAAPSLRALARELGRDYKRVYEDVAALESVGLVERDEGGLRADYDEIRTVITL
jgi:predicted transcriptional regulator